MFTLLDAAVIEWVLVELENIWSIALGKMTRAVAIESIPPANVSSNSRIRFSLIKIIPKTSEKKNAITMK